MSTYDFSRSEWNLNTGQNTNMVFAIPMMATTPIVVANTSTALMTNHGGLPRELMESHQRPQTLQPPIQPQSWVNYNDGQVGPTTSAFRNSQSSSRGATSSSSRKTENSTLALTGSTTPSSTKRKRILRQTQSVPEVEGKLPHKQRHTNGITSNATKCPKCNVSGGIVPIIYGNVNEETQMEANEAKDNDYFYCQSCGTYFDHKGSVMVGTNDVPNSTQYGNFMIF